MINQKMRLRRIERGALTLASAEVKFQIDTETHDPLDIGIIFLPLNAFQYFSEVVQDGLFYSLNKKIWHHWIMNSRRNKWTCHLLILCYIFANMLELICPLRLLQSVYHFGSIYQLVDII